MWGRSLTTPNRDISWTTNFGIFDFKTHHEKLSINDNVLNQGWPTRGSRAARGPKRYFGWFPSNFLARGTLKWLIFLAAHPSWCLIFNISHILIENLEYFMWPKKKSRHPPNIWRHPKLPRLQFENYCNR